MSAMTCHHKDMSLTVCILYVCSETASRPGLLIRSISILGLSLTSVCEIMIHECGSGFWEKTLALPEDRCFPSVNGTIELILHIATSSQLLNKSVFGL